MTPPKETRILIVNAHWNNRGDEAAIRSMVQSLKATFRTDQITMTLPPDADQLSSKSLECKLLRQYPDGYVELTDSLLTLLTWGGVSLTKAGKKFLQAVDECNLVIHAPGGPSIGDIYGRVISGYHYLYRLLLARIVKGKPSFIYAASLGPFQNRFKNLIRKPLLANLDLVVVREQISSHYLRSQLGLESTVTADAALQTPVDDRCLQGVPEADELAGLISQRKSVGVTVVDFGWHPLHSRDTNLQSRIQSTMSEFIDYLIRHGFRVFLIPQVFGWNNREYSLLSGLARGRESAVMVLPRSLDSHAQQALISKMHCLVSMRYHPTIFAANAFVPFVSISYEHKMTGFLDLLGLRDWAVPIEELNLDTLVARFETLNRNYEQSKSKLRERVPPLVQKSRETSILILDAYHRDD